MSILGSIFSKILGHHGAAPGGPTTASNAPPTGTSPGAGPAGPSASTATPTPPVTSAPSPATSPASGPPSTAATASSAPAGAAPSLSGANPAAGPVDVAAVLDGLASSNSQTLDWKHSIVDMMKLLGLDSSLTARQTLAQELHYSGDTHDSATMNVWLHKQVMAKLAENGGKVPADLRA